MTCLLQRQAQRGRTARTARMAIRIISRGTTVVEGPTDEPEIKDVALQGRMRNLLATLLLSQGPRRCCWRATNFGPHPAWQQQCLRAGQRDKAGWTGTSARDGTATESTSSRRRESLSLRRSRSPILRRSRFLTGGIHNADLRREGTCSWADAVRQSISRATNGKTTNARCFGMLMDGRAQATGIRAAIAGCGRSCWC